MQRNTSIDLARFIFAFLVVVIHVPILGGMFITPLARCAVPFFYLVAGFYLYTEDPNKFSSKLKKISEKWFSLWLICTLLFAVIVIALNYIFGDGFSFNNDDAIAMLTGGACEALDIIKIKGKVFGSSVVLWFLYA